MYLELKKYIKNDFLERICWQWSIDGTVREYYVENECQWTGF